SVKDVLAQNVNDVILDTRGAPTEKEQPLKKLAVHAASFFLLSKICRNGAFWAKWSRQGRAMLIE
ncbi:hypothetical protein, partial [Megasphaera sp.]|uniref:hypothetical protein n=1 Tax=Megasphaera sp. TaxID=2023260 RepID=UPI00307A5AE0